MSAVLNKLAKEPAAQGSWNDALLVGLRAIDEPHKVIIGILDRLIALGDTPLRSEAATDLLTELGKILWRHFPVEEVYLKKSAMPRDEVARHIHDHQAIIEKYVAINMAAMANDTPEVRDLVAHTRHCVLDHIVNYDLALKKYLPINLGVTNPTQT